MYFRRFGLGIPKKNEPPPRWGPRYVPGDRYSCQRWTTFYFYYSNRHVLPNCTTV